VLPSTPVFFHDFDDPDLPLFPKDVRPAEREQFRASERRCCYHEHQSEVQQKGTKTRVDLQLEGV
jgi:hypothetical protein